jgi:hypothetical protein
MMILTTAAIGLIAAILSASQPVVATIAKGVAHYADGHSDQAVWIDGQSACDYTFMGPSNGNLCTYNNGVFTASNGYTYRFTGCGGSNFCLLNSDSSVNSCARKSQLSNIGRGCNNDYGSFHVDREWLF